MKSSLSRKEQAAVERLERTHRNEDVHTRHVAALALDLFDAVRETFAFTGPERRLLELAARLHDVGYAGAPLDHVRAGAARVLCDRVLRRPLPERRQLAALILLHSRRDYRAQLAHPVFLHLRDPARVQRLAALLRVADGLDNGHVQDAEIARVRVGKKKVTVWVRTPAWPHNRIIAQRKADLWDAALPLPLRIKAVAAPRKWKLVRRRLPAAEAARRLLSLEYRSAMAVVEEAEAGDAEALHRLRVALRRCRFLLRAFAPALFASPESNEGGPDLRARTARRELVRITTTLGPARDLDVWSGLLPKAAPARGLLARRRAAEQAKVRAAISGPALNALRRAMGLLLRVDLARAQPAPSDRKAGARADQAVRKAGRRAEQLLRQPADSMAARHRLRAVLRRVILMTRVLAPLLPASVRHRARILRKVEQALGRLHDLESLCANLRSTTRNAVLEAESEKRRREIRDQLRRPAFRRALRALRALR